MPDDGVTDGVSNGGSVAVIGAGIVGLAVAHALVRDGARVTVVDRDPGGDKASFGNAGGIGVTECVPASVPGLLMKVPGWLLDPLGPLAIRPAHAPRLARWLWRFSRAGTPSEVARISTALAALNDRVYDDLIPLLDDIGLAGDLHRRGALTVYESEAGFRGDQAEWALKRKLGVSVEELSGAQARAMEPALGPIVQRAVFAPQWSHVDDPKRIVDALGEHLRARQVRFVTGRALRIEPGANGATVVLDGGGTLAADTVVVAAGAWSGELARSLGDRVLLESERGYNTTLPDPAVTLQREVIFAERKFVATPMTCGLRIGGAAEFGGLEAIADHRRSSALVTLARRYLPDLATEGGTPWSGHRPATPDSLPVIGRSPRHPSVIYAFGHGHLGLTHAATTGRLIGDLAAGRSTPVDLTPYAIARFG